MDMGTKTHRTAAAKMISIATDDVTGLIDGTTVMTLDGELPVEHLSAGDRVITRDSGVAVLKDVRVTEKEIAPIEIKAGSLGHTRPDRDTLLAPGAQVHIRDWRAQAMYGTKSANVPARRLTDGEFIAESSLRVVRVYDLVFDRPHVVYADGLEVTTHAV